MSHTPSSENASSDAAPVSKEFTKVKKTYKNNKDTKAHRNTEVKDPADRNYPKDNAAPKPQAPSKVASTPKNDPFVMDEFTIPGFGMKPTEMRPTFTPDFAGFMDLIDQTYQDTASQERSFRQSVPFSIYQYYNVQLLHFRLNELEKLSQRPYDVEHDFRYSINAFTVHESIAKYLQGIGEFKSPDGERFRLASTTMTNINAQGHFGRFDPATSEYYHSIPAPALTIGLIQADVTQPHVPDWDVIPAIRPTATRDSIALPTENLLGWRPSVAPAPKDRPIYGNLGFTPITTPNDTVSNFLFSPKTMDYVTSALVECTKIRTTILKTGNLVGSITQQPYLEAPDPNDCPFRGKYTMIPLQSNARHQFTGTAISSSFVSAYRIKRSMRTDGTAPYLGYVWVSNKDTTPEDEYIPPDQRQLGHPAGYNARLNTRFNSGNSARLNVDYFQTASMPRNQVLMDVLKAFNK